MTLAEKLKEARKNTGMTQAELAEHLCVSRQAITKWESGKGIPDIENLRMISKTLNVSIDFLLDDEGVMNQTVIKEKIDLTKYQAEGIKRSKKDLVVIEKFPDAVIYPLMVEKKVTKGQAILDNFLGFFTDAPFGTMEMYNFIGDIHNTYYLVEREEKQYLVVVSDEFIESRVLNKKIFEKKFNIGEYKYKVLKKIS